MTNDHSPIRFEPRTTSVEAEVACSVLTVRGQAPGSMNVVHGDCLTVMAGMEPESVDAICTDPPYDLLSTGARHGSRRLNNPDNPAGRSARGFMGKAWDGTGIAFRPETWAAALRVAKPSAYLLAFGGTRTVHRMAVAIEDAGWIIRDMLVWAYASGFPKSKASLKPAWEPIVMARKPGPLRMLAIDECRIPTDDIPNPVGPNGLNRSAWRAMEGRTDLDDRPQYERHDAGRWPANVILTDPIFDGDVDGVVGGGFQESTAIPGAWAPRGAFPIDNPTPTIYGDSGTYSRFFLLPRDGRSDALSGIIGTCHICGAPIAETPFTARTRQLDTAPPSAATLPSESLAQPVSGAASPLPSPETATAPRRARMRLDGTPESMASAAVQGIGSGTSAIGPSTLPEPVPATASPSDQPARIAEPPTTSTATTTTTAAPWMCGRCADDATHGRTLPPPRLIGREPHPDEGNYTRFLIVPKADRTDREPVLGGLTGLQPTKLDNMGDWPNDAPAKSGGLNRRNVHPTVKPTELMRHLVRLVTPQGGTVLDPFLGSGTTGIACELEGFPWIGIEKEAEYVAIAEARLNGTQRGMGLSA